MATVAEPETREEPVALELPAAGSVDAILSADDTGGKSIEIPEWGVSVRVRGFTRAEALKWSNTDDDMESNAMVLHAGLVEPQVAMEEAREIIEKKSQAAVVRIVTEVMRLSGLGAHFPVAKPDGPVPGRAAE